MFQEFVLVMQYNEIYRIIYRQYVLEYVWRSIISQNIMLKILYYQVKRLRDIFQTMVFRVGCSLLQGMSTLNIVAT